MYVWCYVLLYYYCELGEEGVYQVLNILKGKVREAFTLSGRRSVTEVQSIRHLVVPKTFL